MVKNAPVNYAIRFSGPVTAPTARRVLSSDSAMLHRLAVAKSSLLKAKTQLHSHP